MGRYDYKSLSPQDFEELTRDLLQAEWNVPLEAFKTGRDRGIDLRFAPLGGGTTIVQCKHYASSSVSSLLSHLRSSEMPKVQRLQPQRYVLVTSLPLSPPDKDKIVEVCKPFLLTPDDVKGADDLDGLLSRHPAIERANFKLWLTSTAVLDRVLHNAEVTQTEFEVERIRRKLPVFVQNKAFPRAQQLLQEQRVAIISGVPGIGKTTLAEMLLFAHLEDGYQPVVIQTDLAEGKRLFRPQGKQIFYYDDFLGQTFLGDQRIYLRSNNDAALISFMEMVRSTPHSKFVLTTREHILRRAFQMSERFLHSAMMDHRCVLELDDYSFGQRARILYNHLYFSDLPQRYRDAILEDDFFLDIIKHDHFNPRLVEWLASLTRLRSPPPEQYRQSITDLLQAPETLWAHAFDTQISDAGRDLLLTLYCLGEWTDVVDLEPAFDALHLGNSERYNRPRGPGDFRAALQELDGAFLSYSSGHAEFINPSIRDFVAGVICRTPVIAFDIASSAVRFKQVTSLWSLATERNDQPLFAALSADDARLRLLFQRVLYGESMRWEKTPRGRIGHPVDAGEEARLARLVEICDALRSRTFVQLCEQYAAHLVARWEKHWFPISSALRALDAMNGKDWYLSNGGQAIYRVILDVVLTRLALADANDWLTLLNFPDSAVEWLETDGSKLSEALDHYRREGVREAFDNCSDPNDLNELRNSLNELTQRYGLDFARILSSIDQAIAERDEREPEYESGGSSGSPLGERAEVVTEDEVREMFSTLRG
ncbi:MAG: restriction endonuclease [Betaproteobacteria bacterium]|nr:restriction endonuclease [Betaproteobacteria bacterium]